MAETTTTKKAMKLAKELKAQGEVALDQVSQPITRARIIRLQEELHIERKKVVEELNKNDRMKRTISALADHIEKMMRMLRIESQAKAKSIEANRAIRKENMKLREIIEVEKRKVKTHQVLAAELHQGSRTLMDQLHLMDEKYLELRVKLDYARHVNKVEIVKAQKKANRLRAKFALISKTHDTLDHVKIPAYVYEEGPQDNENRDGYWPNSADPRVTSVGSVRPKSSTTSPQHNMHNMHGLRRTDSEGARDSALSMMSSQSHGPAALLRLGSKQGSQEVAGAAAMGESRSSSPVRPQQTPFSPLPQSPVNAQSPVSHSQAQSPQSRVSFTPAGRRPNTAPTLSSKEGSLPPYTAPRSGKKKQHEFLTPDQLYQMENRKAMDVLQKKIEDQHRGSKSYQRDHGLTAGPGAGAGAVAGAGAHAGDNTNRSGTGSQGSRPHSARYRVAYLEAAPNMDKIERKLAAKEANTRPHTAGSGRWTPTTLHQLLNGQPL